MVDVDILITSQENICSEDDLRSRIFGTFVVKFLACLPLPRIFEHLKNGIYNTKIRLTMLCLSGFELYSRWVPLTSQH